MPDYMSDQHKAVSRQAYAGLLWSRQFYHYAVLQWLAGDPSQPPPPPGRENGRNAHWKQLFNRDVLSIPDKWEYPWFAAWDLSFHMLPFARIDPAFAKEQLVLLLREWYMHPNGQLPAYEFAFGDANPPVHAWACWRVYKISAPAGQRDRAFLERTFQKLLVNFTWWVNRKDIAGRQVFGGGFLGLDNVGIFDRSKPLPSGEALEQADGTAWMAFYCTTMLAMALELAKDDPVYEDIASKFFEHFIEIADAMNTLGGTGCGMTRTASITTNYWWTVESIPVEYALPWAGFRSLRLPFWNRTPSTNFPDFANAWIGFWPIAKTFSTRSPGWRPMPRADTSTACWPFRRATNC